MFLRLLGRDALSVDITAATTPAVPRPWLRKTQAATQVQDLPEPRARCQERLGYVWQL